MALPPHPLTNFEIQEYYQNEPRFNGVFSRHNLPNTIKNGAYVINLDEYHDIGTHWVALYVNNKTITYFDSFGVEHIPKEIMKFIARKKIITNIYRIQAYDSIMCGYFCIGFINFMFDGKSLTDYTNLFSPNDFNKKDDIILKYFGLQDVKMSKANEISELKDLTKYRLDEINKMEIIYILKLKREKILLKKLVNILLLLIMQTNFLLHYQHRLAL